MTDWSAQMHFALPGDNPGGVEVREIHQSDVVNEWPAFSKLAVRSFIPNFARLEQILSGLLNGRFRLFGFYLDSELRSMVITEATHSNTHRVLVVYCYAGDLGQLGMQVTHELLQRLKREEGAEVIEFYTERRAERTLAAFGYRPVVTLFRSEK